MSKRKPPWWRDPLLQWRVEVNYGIGDCVVANPYNKRQQLMRAAVALTELGEHPAVVRLMRQLLNDKELQPVPIKARKGVEPARRKLLRPLLSGLAIDGNLRGYCSKALTSQERQLLDPVLRHEEEQRTIIDRLSLEQRHRVCAAGYVLLIAALATQAAKANTVQPKSQQVQAYQAGHKKRMARPTDPERPQARAVATELCIASSGFMASR